LKKKDEMCQTRDLEITYLSKELEERVAQLESPLEFEGSVVIQEEEVREIEKSLDDNSRRRKKFSKNMNFKLPL
jgi:hypothetical protein